ncbi:hypothetical protein MLD38_029893 [Melastoma candidum]|uniref:Uncharacterized protein n=1 Tax=Melastoma candidum TaxID=119954 RepID=A0ACB9N5C7_9MYRT|nr:hypothetical protein MLD38_029893 [Melastoma candidum]
MSPRSWMYEESLFSPVTEEAGQNLVGRGRFARHQADETGGSSTKLKKRKLAQLVCIKTVICPLWYGKGRCGFGDYC